MKLPNPNLGPEHPVNHLRELAAAVEDYLRLVPACGPSRRASLEFSLQACDRYETQAPHGVDLDAAFGLNTQRGGARSRWFAVEARAQRDALLREARARHCAGMDIEAAAQAILSAHADRAKQAGTRPNGLAHDVAQAALHADIPGKARLKAILAKTK